MKDIWKYDVLEYSLSNINTLLYRLADVAHTAAPIDELQATLVDHLYPHRALEPRTNIVDYRSHTL